MNAGRLTREDLARAEVLGQVDRKFIACLVRSSPPPPPTTPPTPTLKPAAAETTIILIDQHAAHERIRVETFLRDICTDFLSPAGCVRSQSLVHTGVKSKKAQEKGRGKYILLTTEEANALLLPQVGAADAVNDIRDAFVRWGFAFADLPLANDTDLSPHRNSDTTSTLGTTRPRPKGKEKESSPYTQVEVLSVPQVVSAKVRHFSSECVLILRNLG